MTPQESKAHFDELARRLWELREELESLSTTLTRIDDQKALGRIVTDLTWANENCTVIGLHQVGEALDDNMGTSDVVP